MTTASDVWMSIIGPNIIRTIDLSSVLNPVFFKGVAMDTEPYPVLPGLFNKI